jgi:hypothetical protein
MGASDEEEILSLDLERNDLLYRIRRGPRIVYVNVLHEDIIPWECQTKPSRIRKKLRLVPRWNEEWTTLTVQKTSGAIVSIPDEFAPHFLPEADIRDCHDIRFNILDLTPVTEINDRVSRVMLPGSASTCILKIARFGQEIPGLASEVLIYSTLKSRGFSLAPKFLAYAYEEVEDRIVGILIEDLTGTVPDQQDLDHCERTVRLLHDAGVIHGDAHRYNFLMTDVGAKVFDFEISTVERYLTRAKAKGDLIVLRGCWGIAI